VCIKQEVKTITVEDAVTPEPSAEKILFNSIVALANELLNGVKKLGGV
jgi:hypothetical protein